jgi:hypothetical protein
MPVAEFMGNWAWLQIARLAWNLGKWIAQLALPAEVVRWEWKRFRHHFVYIAAKVLNTGRRLVVQLTDSHRYLPQLLAARPAAGLNPPAHSFPARSMTTAMRWQ